MPPKEWPQTGIIKPKKRPQTDPRELKLITILKNPQWISIDYVNLKHEYENEDDSVIKQLKEKRKKAILNNINQENKSRTIYPFQLVQKIFSDFCMDTDIQPYVIKYIIEPILWCKNKGDIAYYIETDILEDIIRIEISEKNNEIPSERTGNIPTNNNIRRIVYHITNKSSFNKNIVPVWKEYCEDVLGVRMKK